MKRIFTLILALGIFTTLFNSCGEDTLEIVRTGFIKANVVDAVTSEPIAGATVEISPNNQSGIADANGMIMFSDVPVGDYSVQASADDYLARFRSTSVVEDGATGEVTIALEIETTNNRPPDTLLLIAPTNNEMNVSLQPTFSWKATDPDMDDLTFDLFLYEGGTNNEIVFEDITSTEFDLSAQTDPVTFLKFATRYTWQVTASDGINNIVFSNALSFTTIPFPDNNNVYFTRVVNGNSVIFSSDQQGTEESIVPVTDFSKNSFRPRQSSSGVNESVAFLRSVGGETQLFTMNRDGSNVQQITTDVPVGSFDDKEVDFTWSENGSTLIYPGFRRLYEINPDGTGRTRIFSVSSGEFITEVTPVAITGSNAEFAIKVNDSEGYNASIYTIDRNENIYDTVVTNVRGAVGGLDFSIETPVQDYLVYTLDVDGAQSDDYDNQSATRVFVYDFSSDVTAQLTPRTPLGRLHQDPQFSPDNTQIMLVNRNRALNSTDVNLAILTIPDDLTDPGEGEVENVIINGAMPDWQLAQ